MALGGGTFLTQNKVLPGTYINFVSASNASASISDRGYAAVACDLKWGTEGEIFEVTAQEFLSDSFDIFGFDYSSDELKGIKDIFTNANTVYFYRLNGGDKATCSIAKARCGGTRGNDIKITVESNDDGFTVKTLVDETEVDSQTVTSADKLEDNNFVTFIKDSTLTASAGISLSGGTDTESTAADQQKFLSLSESYSFNILACISDDNAIKKLYGDFTKTMREDYGIKFQTVIHNYSGDNEGIINVGTDSKENEKYGLVWWVSGAECACNINESLTNKTYDGEYTPDVDFTQSELVKAINAGKFMLHRNGNDIKVLEDINSFTEFSDTKSSDFSDNQIIRLLDSTGNDIAVMFNNHYLGKVQNNKSGRTAFWNDIVSYNRQLQDLGAIEDFKAEDVTVEIGDDKKTVVVKNSITPVCAMSKLYMTVVVE
ncbi:MAG: phage tail sheath family protein [Clostridia bacterium]|jgi:hypothetical protein|nr:phage tail sheath family protein [Clostridia bacterium]